MEYQPNEECIMNNGCCMDWESRALWKSTRYEVQSTTIYAWTIDYLRF